MNVGVYDFIWLGIALATLAADMFIGFVLFPIYISAFVVFILDLFINNIALEMGIFIVLAIIIFLIFKPKIKRFLQNMPKIENRSFVSVGDEFFVEEVSEDGYFGKIKKDGIFYNIYCQEKLQIGDKVRVTKVDGLKIFVEKIENKV
ncbi:membrane protein implicated in regulation of membrane protease activity [Caldicellulosiruptor bescii]|uniref:Membrane protein implicated in regulation of membrane protease activity n=1 Tax=Caldicellulosiruptor bescii TaxID=31899 RepID=A0ABY1SB15_CALBS|nr:NfeD family protein [Caldicellulosiruptor bescii]PBC87216.1 membrane protein implicated in regulation of membrane protease activity [Caldicellulosiruptor bescii]PBC90155.1 membrane protein implicated in regulation of membrane protease activity [Caldicellulosiruptor bescii]PBD04415.1 membrane protein implicated in regulation of membrane protease activity [Caldicellulosiruptor bescii]PBD05952.1 membrane protein implicated in regulation of membrane protease activity [Caldicellulosiruptor bescii